MARKDAARAPRLPRHASRKRSRMKPPIKKAGPSVTAAKQGRPRMGDRAPDRAQSAPSRRRPVIAFRVLERIGEILVPMMGEMGRAVDRIGKPKRQRPAADRLVDATIPRRMAVDSFVLQIQLPGDDPRAERRESPPRQIAIEIGGQKPEPVNGESERRLSAIQCRASMAEVPRSPRVAPPATRRESPFESDNSKAKPRRSQQFLIIL